MTAGGRCAPVAWAVPALANVQLLAFEVKLGLGNNSLPLVVTKFTAGVVVQTLPPKIGPVRHVVLLDGTQEQWLRQTPGSRRRHR